MPGSYHFRFLKNIGSHIVWLDITDESAALPTHQGSIFIKVTRIATVPQSTAASTASVHQAATPFEPTPIFTASSADSTPQVSPPLKAPKPVVDRRPSEKLLKFEDEVTSPASSTTSGSLLLNFQTYMLTNRMSCLFCCFRCVCIDQRTESDCTSFIRRSIGHRLQLCR